MSIVTGSMVGAVLIALMIALFFQRRRASRPRWRRIVFYVGEKLTASFPVLTEKPVALAIRHKSADGKVGCHHIRVAYKPKNLVHITWKKQGYLIGLRDVDYDAPMPLELNLRVLGQIVHLEAARAQLTVAIMYTRPARSTAAAVDPPVKILARRAA